MSSMSYLIVIASFYSYAFIAGTRDYVIEATQRDTLGKADMTAIKLALDCMRSCLIQFYIAIIATFLILLFCPEEYMIMKYGVAVLIPFFIFLATSIFTKKAYSKRIREFTPAFYLDWRWSLKKDNSAIPPTLSDLISENADLNSHSQK